MNWKSEDGTVEALLERNSIESRCKILNFSCRTPGCGQGQAVLEELRKEFRTMIVGCVDKRTLGYWKLMADRGLIDEIQDDDLETLWKRS